MKYSQIIMLAALLLAPQLTHAVEQSLLAIPGKVIYENKFDTAIGEPWKVLKGDWEFADGAWRGSEKPEQRRAGMLRLKNVVGDFVVEYEFKFSGATHTSLSISQSDSAESHIARIFITPNLVTIQRDLPGQKPDHTVRGVEFGKFPAKFVPGTWHKVRLEMVGDTMLGQVDDLIGWGTDAFFKQAHTVGFTVKDQSVELRNFKLSEAVLNPEWDQMKMKITPTLNTDKKAAMEVMDLKNNDQIWIYAFYRDPGQTGIYLATSEDGWHFTPLNHDQPVMTPPPWRGNQNLTCDPSMIYHDGKFRVVWTSFNVGNCLGYAESADLVHWSQPVRVEPFPASLPSKQQPKNIWCSQICWDPVQKNYMINSSSRIGTNGQQIFLTRTADCKTFGHAQLLLDPGFNCIDGMMTLDQHAEESRWVMFFKNEEPKTSGGKNLRFAIAPADFSKPLAVNPTPVAGPGTQLRPESMTEGPCLVKTKAGWNLYWDIPLKDSYGAASSTDLTNWTDHTSELQLPAHCRHGSFFLAPRAAVGWLQ